MNAKIYAVLATRFAIGGLMGVLVGYCASMVLIYALHVPPYLANVLGYGIGFCANFSTQLKTGVIEVKRD